MTFRTYKLKVKSKTWKRDSYGLFDYETTNYNTQDFALSRGGHIARLNHHISYTSPSSYLDKSSRKGQTESGLEEILLTVTETSEGIQVNAEQTEQEDSNQLWSVIDRGDNSKGHILRANDVIKLGRIKFRVTQVKVISEAEARKANKKSIIDSIKDHMQVAQDPLLNELMHSQELEPGKGSKNSNAGNLCKICLYDKSDEEDDPLISPCKCIGSVKYVHLKCLQNWVKSKLNMQQSKNIITILWKNLSCELCKEKLPVTFNYNGDDLCLIPFDSKITGSYVMMESFSKEKDSTGMHVIDLSSNQNFKIGRGHDCDLKIADISVSRLHAMFVASKGNLYLKDNNSKFGTLVLKRGNLLLNSGNMRSSWFQCGRTILRFTLKKPWMAFVPCLGTFFAPGQPSNMAIRFDENMQNENEGEETMIRATSDGDLFGKKRRASF